MSNDQKGKRPSPFSIRLSFDEKAQLKADAGNMALGAFIRDRIFGEEEPRSRRPEPAGGNKALATLLAHLGRSNLANNLNQLAKAVHSGSLDVTPDTEKTIREAYTEIMWMRSLLVQALGLKEKRGRK